MNEIIRVCAACQKALEIRPEGNQSHGLCAVHYRIELENLGINKFTIENKIFQLEKNGGFPECLVNREN